MAVSNIDINVDDEKFKAFAKVFADHKKAVDSLPAAWKSAAQSASAAKTEFEKGADALAKQAESAAVINKHVGQLTQTSGALSHHWHLMKLNTDGVASNIKDMTSSLTSWAGTLGKITGIGIGAAAGVAGLGAAGFWGMDRLGQGVAAKRMRARGLGTSIGGVASFETAFGRLGDTGQMLNFANVGKTDVSSAERRALGNLGITNDQIKNLSSDELAALEIRKLKEKSNSIHDDNRYFGTMATLGFTDQHSLNVIRHTSGSEIEGLETQFTTNKPKMNIGEDAARKWVDFGQEVQRVKETLTNKFETRLSELGPSLGKLSENLGKAAEMFIDKDLGPLIDKLAGGLDWLAGEAGNKETKKAISGFFDDIKAAAELMGGVVHKLADVGKWLGVDTAQASLGMPPGSPGSPPGGASPEGMEYGPQLPGHVHGQGAEGDRGGSEGPGAPAKSTAEQDASAMSLMNGLMKRGWSEEAAAIMAGNALRESQFDTRWRPGGDQGTARGLMQWRGERQTSHENFRRAHPELSGLDLEAGAIDWEARNQYTKMDLPHAGLGQAGQASHYYEGYGDNSTGERIGNANRYYRMHHKDTPAADTTPKTDKQKVSIRETPGSNVWAQASAVNFGRA